MTNTNYKIGDKVKCKTYFGNFEATITGTQIHKSKKVYDLDNDHFVYASQIRSRI